jgi:hypothetical protein
VTDDLSPDQRRFPEIACATADRFNKCQVDEEDLMNRLGFDEGKFSRVRNDLEDAGYLTRRGAPQATEVGAFWIERAGIDLCPEPLGGRDALQRRE